MAQKNAADLLRAYLIVGTDELKRSAAVARLKTYIPPEWETFCLEELDATELEEPAQLIDPLQTLPFGADIRLVILHNIGKLAKPLSEALIAYLKDPNPQTVLCCEGESLLKTTKLYKTLATMGPHSVIDCGSLAYWQLPPQVIKMASNLELSMDSAAATELVSRLGENTTALENQLKTFVEFYGSGAAITKKIVCDSVAQVAEIKPWAISDALSERNVAEALRLFNLFKEDAYVMLETVITGRIRELIAAKASLERHDNSILTSAIRNPKMAYKYTKWAQNFTNAELSALLCKAALCDAKLKSTSDKEGALITFIVAFAK